MIDRKLLENMMHTKSLGRPGLDTLSRVNKSYKKQGGMSFIGTILIIAMLLFIAIIGMRVLPAYTEYMSVRKALRDLGRESLATMSKKEIMDSYDRKRVIDDIKSVAAGDLTIQKDDAGNTVVSVEYQVIRPIVANVSALIDFKASSNAK